jgi:DNA-directed RNA polymerase
MTPLQQEAARREELDELLLHETSLYESQARLLRQLVGPKPKDELMNISWSMQVNQLRIDEVGRQIDRMMRGMDH